MLAGLKILSQHATQYCDNVCPLEWRDHSEEDVGNVSTFLCQTSCHFWNTLKQATEYCDDAWVAGHLSGGIIVGIVCAMGEGQQWPAHIINDGHYGHWFISIFILYKYTIHILPTPKIRPSIAKYTQLFVVKIVVKKRVKILVKIPTEKRGQWTNNLFYPRTLLLLCWRK